MLRFPFPVNSIDTLFPEQLDHILRIAGNFEDAHPCNFFEYEITEHTRRFRCSFFTQGVPMGLNTGDSECLGNLWGILWQKAYVDVRSGWCCCALVCKQWNATVANYMTKASGAKMLLETETCMLYRHAKQKGEYRMYTATIRGHTCVFSLETEHQKLLALTQSGEERLPTTSKSKPVEIARMILFEMLQRRQFEFNAEEALVLMTDVPRSRRFVVYKRLRRFHQFGFKCCRIDCGRFCENAVFRISTCRSVHIVMVHGPEFLKEQTRTTSLELARYIRVQLRKLKERPASSMSRNAWMQLVTEIYTHFRTKVSDRFSRGFTEEILQSCSGNRHHLVYATIHHLTPFDGYPVGYFDTF